VISKGWGSTYWTSGCIDFLGFSPPDYPERVGNPLKAITDLVASKPDHPYALAGTSLLEEAVNKFIDLTDRYSYPYQGSINQNFLLPTAVGSVRPTCLAPLSMVAGDVRLKTPMLIIGFDQFLDFYPGYITDNLVQQGILARGISVDIKTLDKLKFLSASVLARLFDKPSFREEVIAAIRPLLGTAGRIGFPAVLGLNNTNDVIHNLEDSFGLPVFEIPGLPPSVPGIRLNNLMVSAIENNGGTVNTGMNVNSFTSENTRITSVLSDASNRKVLHTGENYILASGGILGGGITVDENGYAKDTVFNLPINLPPHRIDRFRDRFLAREGQPIYLQGLSVNALLHPLEKNNHDAFENLYAVGTILNNCDPIREASIQGIALATGLAVAKNLGV
jgi:glycerol-3-phosphate dehydrogenase subunit B